MQHKPKVYLISIGIALAVGGLSALLTLGNMDLYSEIVQPPLAPPAILFPIVWTILYTLMGVGSARIYLSREGNMAAANRALLVYGANLLVNFYWSLLFFNQRAFFLSFAWLLLLWGIILWMIFRFFRVNRVAAYLQIPYLVWVTFAGYLNLAIAILNR